MQRNRAFDAIRILLTALVVFHHAAIAYGGSGGWYWREVADSSNLWLVSFNAFNQSFFMGFFFLLGGYYTQASLNRHSAWRYIWDRLLRLGVPLVVFFFVLQPLTIALAHSQSPGELPAMFMYFFRDRQFGPGPLWFVAALLVMSFTYMAVRRLLPLPQLTRVPSFWRLLPILLLLGALSFVIRLKIPVGEEWYWMQLGFFVPYVFLFVVGALGYNSRLLETITLRQCIPWLFVSALALLALALMLNYRSHLGGFHGGWNLNAVFYAFWDPLVATGVILGLLWGLARLLPPDSKSGYTDHVARRVYGVYILHAPVLVGLMVLAAGWSASPVVKFMVVGSLGCVLCVLLTSALLRLPGCSRVL